MGFMTMGPLGALAGYFIGSWFDKQAVGMQEDLQADEAGRARYEQGQRNSFLFSMLVMASYVIRADRKIMHSEMEFVRRFLRANFGESAVEEGEQILLKLFDEAKRLDGVSPVAFRNMIFDCGTSELRRAIAVVEFLGKDCTKRRERMCGRDNGVA